jgi:pimeloyl-ACP methyl ester carboxylesterase
MIWNISMAQIIANTPMGPIEYRLEGHGPTIMVLNGGHCSRNSRLSHEKLADQGFRLLTPSRPGYDGTPARIGRSAQAAADALASLLDTLDLQAVDVIGISAAGPTALAFARQHPQRIRRLVLESAMVLEWNDRFRRLSWIPFGPAEKVTWAIMRLMLNVAPAAIIRLLLRDLTCLDVHEVYQALSPNELDFIERMIRTSRSGRGFLNDIEHRVDQLGSITCPTLIMYSPNDRTVSPRNSRYAAAELPQAELYEVPSPTHLIWIGAAEDLVWQKRLAFLQTDMPLHPEQH